MYYFYVYDFSLGITYRRGFYNSPSLAYKAAQRFLSSFLKEHFHVELKICEVVDCD